MGRVLVSATRSGVASALETSSGLRDRFPKLFPLMGDWVYCLVPEALLIRGMSTGPKVFLALPDACGLRPCDQIHLKKPGAKLACSLGRLTDN